MKKIILKAGIVITTLGAIVAGGTGAFFSDTETSTGNTFTAGDIDLKIDNESYYNGEVSTSTSWELVDLTIEKFFNFLDLKPGDYGEDTISLHVESNDAYLCADVALTSNDDNGLNEPESEVDSTDGPGNGELGANVNFIWWADDGDNVLETNENVISQGPIGAIGTGSTTTVTLADSATNIWTGSAGPVSGEETLYIGKAWCFGTLSPAPLTQNGLGTTSPTTPANSTGGISCDGSNLDNSTQTDSLTADVTFEAVQARNNDDFLCAPGQDCAIDTVTSLLPDGGFENPEVATAEQWNVFPSPAGNWNVLWRSDLPSTFGPQTRPAIANLELHEGVLGAAIEGNQYAELDSDWGGPSDSETGEPSSVKIYQDIPTVVGKDYEIRYHFAARPDTAAADNNVEVRWGGVAVDTTGQTAGAPGPIVWNERIVSVTATTTTTRVEFTDIGIANSLGSFIDNIRLYQEVCGPITR